MSLVKRLLITLEMIKIEHTLFALPFALIGAVLAAQSMPVQSTGFWLVKLVWILVAMVGARSAAMAFNRIVDLRYDTANPRTAGRALPAGHLDKRFVWIFTIVSSGLFVFAAHQLNTLAFALSPVALISILGYSFTKRITFASHLILGWCLAIAPSGAWIAIRGKLELIPILLSAVVLLWTAGFDILYACQDVNYDREAGLHSIPQRFGISKALIISRALHMMMFILLLLVYVIADLGWTSLAGLVATGCLLVFQHSIIKSDDLSHLNAAFFTTNAFVSVILFSTVAIDALLKGWIF